MRYWLNLAAMYVERREAAQARCVLCFALADANREAPHKRGAILRAINYCRAIEAQERGRA